MLHTLASFLAAFLAFLLICLVVGLSAAKPSVAELETLRVALLVNLTGSPFFLLLHMLLGRNGYKKSNIMLLCNLTVYGAIAINVPSDPEL